MADSLTYLKRDLASPFSSLFDATPNDTVDLANPCRALYVGTVGDVKLTTVDGTVITLRNVSGLLPVRVARIWATGTTATNIVYGF